MCIPQMQDSFRTVCVKNLDLSHTEVSVLPKGITVDGYADLSGTQI